MARQRLTLLVINVVGAVLIGRSYLLGLSGPAGVEALWGGVPQGARPFYYVSMVLAALGYAACLYFLLLRVVPGEVTVGRRFGYGVFYLIYIVILLAASFWTPLSRLYLEDPTNGVLVAVRVILAVVGVAALALVWAFLSLRPGNRGAHYWAAVVGSGYFAFHATVLDAIVWALMFPR